MVRNCTIIVQKYIELVKVNQGPLRICGSSIRLIKVRSKKEELLCKKFFELQLLICWKIIRKKWISSTTIILSEFHWCIYTQNRNILLLFPSALHVFLEMCIYCFRIQKGFGFGKYYRVSINGIFLRKYGSDIGSIWSARY